MDVQKIPDLTIARQLYEGIANGKYAGKVQLFFTADVLNAYREQGSYKIIRTDTSGRVSRPGGWSVDFGISGDNDQYVHMPVEALTARIPDAEKAHWLEFMVSLPISANFLKGLIRPGCLDDGDIRSW